MEKLIDCIMDIGEQMLISGGEVHSVEENLKKLFNAYNTTHADVFIITSSMVVTVHTIDGKVYTQTRRITETVTDYEKLHKLNELAHNICQNKFSHEEIRDKLSVISTGKSYPLWLEFICYAIIAGVFTLFFGGEIVESAVSFIIGMFVRFIIFICDKTFKNKIFIKFTSALIATVIAFLALKLNFISKVDMVIIGNIMTLIPGIGLTTALKDLLVGDSIAGLFRIIEACISALAIAAGYFVVVILSGGAL